jgi:chemotaxis protein methyltransferase CheR
MKSEDFDFLSNLLKKRSGLIISEDKLYLLESRLMPLARKRGMNGLDDLLQAIRFAPEEDLLVDVTEAMTTNESSFFRDIKPFENFRKLVLPALLEKRADKRSIRIWCAAASTGQEPYSLAMCLREEAAKLSGWRIEIVATDLSKEVLEKASVGLYSQFEVQRGLPIQLLMKYFSQVNDLWQIDSSIRAMIKYQSLNLLDNFTHLGAFDVVFCRNVLIYFEQQTKSEVLGKIANMMPSDGYLFLGGAETVLNICDAFKPIANYRGVYGLAPLTPH